MCPPSRLLFLIAINIIGLLPWNKNKSQHAIFITSRCLKLTRAIQKFKKAFKHFPNEIFKSLGHSIWHFERCNYQKWTLARQKILHDDLHASWGQILDNDGISPSIKLKGETVQRKNHNTLTPLCRGTWKELERPRLVFEPSIKSWRCTCWQSQHSSALC